MGRIKDFHNYSFLPGDTPVINKLEKDKKDLITLIKICLSLGDLIN